MTYVAPGEVRSPKARWHLFKVLLDDGAEGCAYALGKWDEKPRIGFRWNGSNDNPIGNPQSRGLPTWTMLDERLHGPIIDRLPPDKQQLARGFLEIDE